MNARIVTFSSHGDTTLLEYDPASADMDEVNKVIAEYEAKTGAQGVDLFEQEDRAKAYLRRIVALTGAVQIGNNYVLEIGTTRFHVRDRYVRRLQGVSDPKCEYEETRFCLPYTRVPTAEQIATALLALANNPALFDRWAARIGAVKADGEAFARALGGRLAMKMQTKCIAAQRAGDYLKRIAALTGAE